MIKNPAIMLAILVGFGASAHAETTIYFGVGENNDGGTVQTDDMPFVFGFLGSPDASPLIYGFDFAAEGEMLDSTFGSDAFRQAYSFNGLIGTNLYRSSDLRIDGAAIIGLRESFSDCADSFIGFQCYADVAPDTEYDFNYGALISASVSNVMLGVRVTEVSTQAVLGFSF